MRQRFSPILLLLLLIGCSTQEEKGEVVVKVYDKQLYDSDLKEELNRIDYSAEDSAQIAEAFIQDWIDEQILLHEAENNDKIDQFAIDKKVADFRNELFVHELVQQLVTDQLDTVVSDKEIKTYYEKHKEDFQLNDYLVKVIYIKIPEDAPDIDKIASMYKLQNPSDIEEIETYAKIYASNYYYDENNWIYFDDLLKEIPLQDINKDRFIMKRSKIRFEDRGYHYFLNILDYKLKNTISPLSFEKNNIRERIINARVLDLRKQIKTDLIKKAYDNNEVKKY